MTIQRREVKPPFTKEEREGVFVTREESRLRRKKMSLETSLQEIRKVIADQNEIIVMLCKEKNALQAKIDSLMLEFYPEEMTQEQIENWQQHQVKRDYSTKQCCEGGPQWGHALDCPKCPD